jgi:hypothetical protein
VNGACQSGCQESTGERPVSAILPTDAILLSCEGVKEHHICCNLASVTKRDLLAATLTEEVAPRVLTLLKRNLFEGFSSPFLKASDTRFSMGVQLRSVNYPTN